MSKKKENPLYNILFNIVIPVLILNKLSPYLGEKGPVLALLLALSFPLIYGGLDYLKNRTHNIVSILGIVNIVFTGGLALMELEGEWFAWKEAGFPLVIGLAVLFSAFTKKPLINLLIGNENFMNKEKIDERLEEYNTREDFSKHLKVSTYLFAVSFFISAVLNYILAKKIFIKIDPTLPEAARTTMLNEQIAEMTWQGYIVIALPLMLFTFLIIWHVVHGIKKYTKLSLEEVLPASHSPNS